MRYFIIVGEPSGDLHAANLMRGILKEDPSAEFRFWGGDKMAEVGGVENLGKHYRESSFFGFVQVILNLPTILGQLAECKREVKEYAPDVLILVDYAGFNLKMAKYAKSIGIKTHYYIAPKVWAWNEGRIKLIHSYADELYVIFPFERDYFVSKGITPHFEGNPLVDALAQRRDYLPSREVFLRVNNLEDRPIIAILAGSRRSEIKANLEFMTQVAKAFPKYQFIVAGVEWIDKSEYDKYLKNSQINYITNQTYELLNLSEAALVTSGTATLETALMGIPEVVVFRVPKLHEVLMPYFLKIPFISLVNLSLGRESVREIVQSSMDPTDAISALNQIVEGGEGRQKMLEDFEELRQIIGEEGASDRFAKKIVNLLKK
ncbi:MAG: lipid-A-disaccharide synthase [Rikenellaceae bacterium]